MIPKEEIKDKPDEYVKYYGLTTSFDDITTNIKNNDPTVQQVLLIYLAS